MPATITIESEQLTLFTFDQNGNALCENKETPNIVVYPGTVREVKAVKETAGKSPKPVPDRQAKKEKPKDAVSVFAQEPRFNALLKQVKDLADDKNAMSLLNLVNVSTFSINRVEYSYSYPKSHEMCWAPKSKSILYQNRKQEVCQDSENKVFKMDKKYQDGATIEINIVYVSEQTGNAVVIPVAMSTDQNIVCDHNIHITNVDAITVKKPFVPVRLLQNTVFVQSDGEITEIIRNKKPWLANWIAENSSNGYDLKACILAPWLETLDKAGFREITQKFITSKSYTDKDEFEEFNRLCGAGTKPKDIFKCSKSIQTVLKHESRLSIWDTFRKLEKRTSVNEDAIRILYQMNIRSKELEKIYSILAKKHNNKFIFSVESLVNYLGRLDMYEALETTIAIQYLYDYLNMCSMLNMPPRIDGDSLRREHDIAARLCREQRNKIHEEKMRQWAEKEKKEIEEGNSKISRAEYHENVFFIRPILEYQDLLDEAIQQDNCVASYADRIASGHSRIFTMRETAHPEKSLITIELSPDCKTIRQKYLAHNQVIHNKAMNDFITRWHRQLNGLPIERNA